MQIRALVGDGAQACGPDTSLREAAIEMQKHDIGSLAVIGNGEMLGILTERDILRAVAKHADLDTAPVRDLMTSQPDSVAPDVESVEAARWMLATGYRHLPVIEDGKLLGIASIKDLLWAITPVDED